MLIQKWNISNDEWEYICTRIGEIGGQNGE